MKVNRLIFNYVLIFVHYNIFIHGDNLFTYYLSNNNEIKSILGTASNKTETIEQNNTKLNSTNLDLENQDKIKIIKQVSYSKQVDNCITEFPNLENAVQKISFIFHAYNSSLYIYNKSLNKKDKKEFDTIVTEMINNNEKINIKTGDRDLANITNPETVSNTYPNIANTIITSVFKNLTSDESTLMLDLEYANITNDISNNKSINCLCQIIIETQWDLNLNTTDTSNCNLVINNIINIRKSMPTSSFDILPTSFNPPPSSMQIPDEYKTSEPPKSWKDALVISSSKVANENSTINTSKSSSNNNKIVRTLKLGREIVLGSSTSTSLSHNESYYDSRDIDKGYSCVYSPYNQGYCGGCYAFASVEVLNTATCVQTGNLVAPLSPQQILDCTTEFGNKGCQGGFYGSAWYYLLETNQPRVGSCSWESYPFVYQQESCSVNKCTQCEAINSYQIYSGYSINGNDGWEFVTEMLPKYGAIAVGVNSRLPGFNSYMGGIYKAPECTVSNDIEHAVVLIGFGISDSGEKYFVMQNSWGPYWGINGFMNVSADSCSMFWLPGIVIQDKNDSINKCFGIPSLLMGPGSASPGSPSNLNMKSSSSKFSLSNILIITILITQVMILNIGY